MCIIVQGCMGGNHNTQYPSERGDIPGGNNINIARRPCDGTSANNNYLYVKAILVNFWSEYPQQQQRSAECIGETVCRGCVRPPQLAMHQQLSPGCRPAASVATKTRSQVLFL